MSGDFFIRSSLLPSSLSLTGAGARSAGTLATLASLTGARSAGTLATLASLTGAGALDVLNGASLSLTGAGARSAGTLATLASLSGASELASPEGGVLIDL